MSAKSLKHYIQEGYTYGIEQDDFREYCNKVLVSLAHKLPDILFEESSQAKFVLRSVGEVQMTINLSVQSETVKLRLLLENQNNYFLKASEPFEAELKKLCSELSTYLLKKHQEKHKLPPLAKKGDLHFLESIKKDTQLYGTAKLLLEKLRAFIPDGELQKSELNGPYTETLLEFWNITAVPAAKKLIIQCYGAVKEFSSGFDYKTVRGSGYTSFFIRSKHEVESALETLRHSYRLRKNRAEYEKKL